MAFKRNRLFPWVWVSLAAVFLSGCGAIDSEPDANDPSLSRRRLFVNDPAQNDSLSKGLVGSGLNFILQPGLRYRFQAGALSNGEKLDLYRYENGHLQWVEKLSAQTDSKGPFFDLASTRPLSDFFMGKLLSATSQAHSEPGFRVFLVPVDSSESNALSIHLFMAGKIFGLPTASAKAIFADSLFSQMKLFFSAWNISLSYSYEILDGNGAPVVVEFGNSMPPLPGTRIPGKVHLYLVDSIFIKNAGAGTILGFAPREAYDLDRSLSSRVILNSRAGSISLMATTVTHELGHFFGLRHTVASDLDLAYENDWSNKDDGFPSTGFCARPILNSETSLSSPISLPSQTFCLYRAGLDCSQSCDPGNLMFPFDCSRNFIDQTKLQKDQQSFLRKGMKILQR